MNCNEPVVRRFGPSRLIAAAFLLSVGFAPAARATVLYTLTDLGGLGGTYSDGDVARLA
jgi:hypothetical protein